MLSWDRSDKKKRIIAFLVIFLLFSWPYCILNIEASASNEKYNVNIKRAVNYLLDHYNSEFGLIYESEDDGIHWLKQVEYPDYKWDYNQTYWLYSDNLIAAYALEPWAPEISAKIKETIDSYNIPKSNKFEALFGEVIGIDRGANNIIVSNSSEYVFLIRRHEGVLPDPRHKFADNMIYEALSKFYKGEIEEAQNKIFEVFKMWNGTCIVDSGVIQKKPWSKSAPSDIGLGQNFKLALLLFGARVTETNLPNYNELEDVLWSKQQENGGITTLSLPQGQPIGSANTETTALTILIYNDQLIYRLQSIGNASKSSDFKNDIIFQISNSDKIRMFYTSLLFLLVGAIIIMKKARRLPKNIYYSNTFLKKSITNVIFHKQGYCCNIHRSCIMGYLEYINIAYLFSNDSLAFFM